MANPTKDPDIKANGASYSPSGTPQAPSHSTIFGTSLEKSFDRFAHDTSASLSASRSYVEQKPIQSVAMAAAAGLAVGSLLTMALRQSR